MIGVILAISVLVIYLLIVLIGIIAGAGVALSR
jgi:hypothetical protein